MNMAPEALVDDLNDPSASPPSMPTMVPIANEHFEGLTFDNGNDDDDNDWTTIHAETVIAASGTDSTTIDFQQQPLDNSPAFDSHSPIPSSSVSRGVHFFHSKFIMHHILPVLNVMNSLR